MNTTPAGSIPEQPSNPHAHKNTMEEPLQHPQAQAPHFTALPTRRSESETGEKREPKSEFGFGLNPESLILTPKVRPFVQSPPNFQEKSNSLI